MRSVFTTDILQQVLQHGVRPRMRGMAQYTIQQSIVPLLLLRLRHGETLVDGSSDTEQVVRIDSQGRLERG